MKLRHCSKRRVSVDTIVKVRRQTHPDAILRYGATNFAVDVFTSYFALLRKMIRVADNVLKQAVLHPLSLCKIIEFYEQGRWCCFLSPCGRGGRDPSRLMMLPGSYRNLINDYADGVLHLKLASAFVLNYATRFLLWRRINAFRFNKRWRGNSASNIGCRMCASGRNFILYNHQMNRFWIVCKEARNSRFQLSLKILAVCEYLFEVLSPQMKIISSNTNMFTVVLRIV